MGCSIGAFLQCPGSTAVKECGIPTRVLSVWLFGGCACSAEEHGGVGASERVRVGLKDGDDVPGRDSVPADSVGVSDAESVAAEADGVGDRDRLLVAADLLAVSDVDELRVAEPDALGVAEPVPLRVGGIVPVPDPERLPVGGAEAVPLEVMDAVGGCVTVSVADVVGTCDVLAVTVIFDGEVEADDEKVAAGETVGETLRLRVPVMEVEGVPPEGVKLTDSVAEAVSSLVGESVGDALGFDALREAAVSDHETDAESPETDNARDPVMDVSAVADSDAEPSETLGDAEGVAVRDCVRPDAEGVAAEGDPDGDGDCV
jgi:hypothetical protein